ncbi:fimbria/pilus chaperone family protein [Pseudomonas sp. GZD-222]|uniref:fimbria/pilus chaperone family protein n=1 Tax=Pseudomonas sp. GZD-222 TaxID=3404805 RepID=UPI003BB70345
MQVKHSTHYSLGVFIALSVAWLPHAASATGMVPETSVVIIEEGKGEGSINIKNTDNQPALLYTSLENVPEDKEALLVVTPPVARVDSGGSQLVRFVLQSPQPLKTERLKRVIFEGIGRREKTGGARVAISLRQNLPVIIRPTDLPLERAPWTRLKWSLKNGALQVVNDSPYVVRLAAEVKVQPADLLVDLGKTYVLPGERLSRPLGKTPGAPQDTVRISPATTYGFSVESYDAQLYPNEVEQ